MSNNLVLSGDNYIVQASCDELMKIIPSDSIDAIYTDPPFNTGVTRVDPRNNEGLYQDNLDFDVWMKMMHNLALQAKRVLKPTGSLFLHLDWRGVHDVKVNVLDDIFGRINYVGEIIWAYDWGARQKNMFARKHDTILHYVKDEKSYYWDNSKVDRVPYKAPSLQMYRNKRLGKNDGAERIAAGKTVTDVFDDINVLGTASKERSNNSYPTMKPIKLLKRLLAPVTKDKSYVLDPFCGSGPIVAAASMINCSFIAGDISNNGIATTTNRATKLDIKFNFVKC